MRPLRLVVCFGTATEIGKTWVGGATLSAIKGGGHSLAARKPAQSFDPDDTGPTDAEVLAAATGEDPETVCAKQWWLPIPLAPPMAATALGLEPPTLAGQVADIEASWPDAAVDVGWVETVGGPRSPIAIDGDGVDLACALQADQLLLVGDAALGTINAVRLCVDALAAVSTPSGETAPVVVLLNRYDESVALHRDNLTWLRERCGFRVVTSPAEAAPLLAGS